jgi:hypothetical protein
LSIRIFGLIYISSKEERKAMGLTKCDILRGYASPEDEIAIGKNMGMWSTKQSAPRSLEVHMTRWITDAKLVENEERITELINSPSGSSSEELETLRNNYQTFIDNKISSVDWNTLNDLTSTINYDVPEEVMFSRILSSFRSRAMGAINQIAVSNRNSYAMLQKMNPNAQDPAEKMKYDITKSIFVEGANDLQRFTGLPGGIKWKDYLSCEKSPGSGEYFKRSDLEVMGYVVEPNFFATEEDYEAILPVGLTDTLVPFAMDAYLYPDYSAFLIVFLLILLLAIIYIFFIRGSLFSSNEESGLTV